MADSMDIIKNYFQQISLEVQPLDTDDYRMLMDHGLHSVYVYQETYNRERYPVYHLRGRKTDYRYRLETPDRLCEAGIYKVGVGNLTEANQQKFAEILAWAVEEYDLDGIDFDDEWANYGENPNFPSSVDGSFSGLIIKLRNELDERFPNEHKLITVLNIGNASTLSSDAIADCDFGWSGNFGPNTYNSNPILWPKEKWAAQAIDLSQLCSPNMYILNQISTRCTQTLNDGMGAILTYGLRNHTECDPLPVLQRIASTIFSNTVTRSSTPANGYTKDWSGDSGTAITYDDID